MSANYSLQNWYDSIREQGQSKALAHREQRLLSDAECQHTTHKVKVQFPIRAKSLDDRIAKKSDNAPKKIDTLDSLFNIF